MDAARSVQSGLGEVLCAATSIVKRLLREDAGQDLIEYALIFTFVALGALASMKTLTAAIIKVFSTVGSTLTSAT